MTDYTLPRSVGAWNVVPDMSMGPLPWWSASPGKRPLAETFGGMRDGGLTAVATMLRAHPTINYWENIRKAMRTKGIDVILLTLFHWANTEWDWEHKTKNVRWENLPHDIFDLLYRHYGGQEKVIIVQTMELDWTVSGIGCRERGRCIKTDGRWEHYRDASRAGTLVPYPEIKPGDHNEIACDMVKIDRASYLIGELSELQRRCEQARADRPNAKLRVFFSVECNFFRDETYIVGRDLIPKMDTPPDLIGLSLYRKAGDHVAAFENVRDWTGLPPERIFIGEVGAQEGSQKNGGYITGTPQRDRVWPVIGDLFELGVPIAFVWSWAEVPQSGGHTGYSVNDAVTGEPLSGRTAIEDLNAIWRSP